MCSMRHEIDGIYWQIYIGMIERKATYAHLAIKQILANPENQGLLSSVVFLDHIRIDWKR